MLQKRVRLPRHAQGSSAAVPIGRQSPITGLSDSCTCNLYPNVSRQCERLRNGGVRESRKSTGAILAPAGFRRHVARTAIAEVERRDAHGGDPRLLGLPEQWHGAHGRQRDPWGLDERGSVRACRDLDRWDVAAGGVWGRPGEFPTGSTREGARPPVGGCGGPRYGGRLQGPCDFGRASPSSPPVPFERRSAGVIPHFPCGGFVTGDVGCLTP